MSAKSPLADFAVSSTTIFLKLTDFSKKTSATRYYAMVEGGRAKRARITESLAQYVRLHAGRSPFKQPLFRRAQMLRNSPFRGPCYWAAGSQIVTLAPASSQRSGRHPSNGSTCKQAAIPVWPGHHSYSTFPVRSYEMSQTAIGDCPPKCQRRNPGP